MQRSLHAYLYTVITLCAVVFLCGALPTHAQFGGTSGGAELELTPKRPGADELVRADLSAYSLNTSGASIRWYADGSEIPDSQNARSVEITTGALGSSMTVRADITLTGGQRISTSRTITPTELDLIVEANTSVPSLYRGRALPATGEPVSVTAVVHTGETRTPNTLTYTWRLGNDVLFSGPVRGRDRIDITMPQYDSILSVRIADAAGNELTSKAIVLRPATPELYFYEENPLRGLSTRAIGDTFTLLGEETTVRAEPYFIASDIFTRNPVFEWTLDGAPVNTAGEDSQTITLRGAGGRGTARVEFSLINRTALLQSVRESFSIFFEN